ncbi:MAG: hypothetical protein FJZ01_04015 [Candidatus Sericytochromatia bacterium]|nr:hypothetical protein [Candidatus Tanganyikabacteria bacterium]
MIVYETAGGGHLANARAIQAALTERHPELDVFMLHIGHESRSQRLKALYEVYNTMLKGDPRMVKMGFRVISTFNPEEVVMPFLGKARHNLEAVIRREKPDLIVSVFSVINQAALSMLRNLGWQERVPYLIFCTDLSHGFLKNWVRPEAAAMIALSDEAADQMVEFGYQRSKIKVLHGLPVHPDFLRIAPGKDAARRQLYLQDRFTALITMGGVAGKGALRAARELANCGLPIQIVVVCGRNRLMERRVKRLAARSAVPLRVYGFTDQMHLLMEAADVVVTKPGPGTIAEAVMKLRPLLVDGTREPMPQEVGNLEYVARHGLGDIYEHPGHLTKLVRRYMDDRARYEAAVKNMAGLRNPDAVFDLAEFIVSKVPEQAHTAPLAGVG